MRSVSQDFPTNNAVNIPGSKLQVLPGNVAHYVFLDICTQTGRKTTPGLCVEGKGVERDAIHSRTVRLALDFF